MSSPRDQRGRSGREPDEPDYTLYRSKPGFLSRLGGGDRKLEDLQRQREPTRYGGKRRVTPFRVLVALAALLAGWLLLSLVLFLVSAQIQKGKVSDATKAALDDGGNVVLSANTILVLGSDARPKGSGEAGASTVGEPSRSDTIMLLRVGGGKSARLSIPRDTIVDIPGAGRNKINAAYAIGGPQLTIRTVKRFLGIDVNHLIEVDFQNFPKFVDALGGIDFTPTECVRAKVDGGYRNGGTVIRLRKGQTKHLDGKRVLGLARIRKNDCRPAENDLDRARRQQQIISAIKSRVTSLHTFFRLPWVSWTAPRAIRTDMGGVTLMGLFTDLALGGTPATRVLQPSGFETLPDGGVGLQMSEREVRAETRRFLKG
jgi:LCP family protein required for cell wall assembly